MKKIPSLVLSLLAVVMFTACNNDEDPVNKDIINMDINSRVIDGDNMVFSQFTSTVELNYTDWTIQISSAYTDIDGQKRTLNIPATKISAVGNSIVYRFSTASTQSLNSIQDLEGYIDMASGMMWYSFTDNNGSKVFSTTQLLYAYNTTSIINPENGKQYSHDQSEYLFVIDSTGEKGTFVINNFIPNTNGIVQAAQIHYQGATVTPTSTGYTVTADSLESSYSGYYTISNLQFTLDNQCRSLNGHFTCNGLEFNVTGQLYPASLSL